MKCYSIYKNSGDGWIGEIPKDWNKISIKYLGFLYGGLTGKSAKDFGDSESPNARKYIPYTNVFRNHSIDPSHLEYVNIEDGENQNEVLRGDLLFLMSSEGFEDLGKSAVVSHDPEGILLNSFCRGLRLFRDDCNPSFLNYALAGTPYRKKIENEGNGFTRINLRSRGLQDLRVFLPDLEEQLSITLFLDHKTAVIDSLIEKKKHKIELLKEQRASLISHAVTKGLNPDAEMIDSGDELIGEIPSHWRMSRPKYESLSSCQYGLNIGAGSYRDYGVRFLRTTDFDERGELSSANGKYLDPTDVPSEYLLERNDILLCRSGATVGKSYMHLRDDESSYAGYLVRFNFGSYFRSRFFFYLTKSVSFFDWVKISAVVSTIENLNGEKYSNFQFPLPPDKEQEMIVLFLERRTREIGEIIQQEERLIDLIQEYRQSLISEAVTGKIDVRDWSPSETN